MSKTAEELILAKLIRQLGEQLSNTDELIIDAILSNLKRFEHSTITALACDIGISTTPISKLAQKLGYKGFSDFKYGIIALYKETLQNIVIKTHSPHFADSLKQLSAMLIHHFNQFTSQLDPLRIELLVDYLKQTQKCMVLSTGFSKITGDYLAYRMQLTGKETVSVEPGYPQELFTVLCQRSDLLIVVSRSGETRALEKKIKETLRANKPVLLITATQFSYLAQYSKLTIEITDNVKTVTPYVYSGFQVNAIFFIDLITLLL